MVVKFAVPKSLLTAFCVCRVLLKHLLEQEQLLSSLRVHRSCQEIKLIIWSVIDLQIERIISKTSRNIINILYSFVH